MILLIVLYFLPDSPHHLVKIGDLKAARKSLQWYRGGVKNVEMELQGVVKFVELTASSSFLEKLGDLKLYYKLFRYKFYNSSTRSNEISVSYVIIVIPRYIFIRFNSDNLFANHIATKYTSTIVDNKLYRTPSYFLVILSGDDISCQFYESQI